MLAGGVPRSRAVCGGIDAWRAERPRLASRPDGRPAPVIRAAVRHVAVLLAEHLHLGAGVVDVDGDLVELVDELLELLRLEFVEVDRYP